MMSTTEAIEGLRRALNDGAVLERDYLDIYAGTVEVTVLASAELVHAYKARAQRALDRVARRLPTELVEGLALAIATEYPNLGGGSVPPSPTPKGPHT